MIQTENIDTTKVLDVTRNINPIKTLNSKDIVEFIQIIEPIKVIDVTNKGFDFWLPILIAGIPTAILIWNQIKKSKIYGKIISKTYSETGSYTYSVNRNEQNTIEGQLYLLRLSLSCLRKNLNYKNVKVYLTYGNEKVVGEIFWTKYTNIKLYNPIGILTPYQVETPSNKFLTFHNVLEEGKTSFFYLNFIVPGKIGRILYDRIELEFIKPNDKKIKVEIIEIDPKQFFFDENRHQQRI